MTKLTISNAPAPVTTSHGTSGRPLSGLAGLVVVGTSVEADVDVDAEDVVGATVVTGFEEGDVDAAPALVVDGPEDGRDVAAAATVVVVATIDVPATVGEVDRGGPAGLAGTGGGNGGIGSLPAVVPGSSGVVGFSGTVVTAAARVVR